MKTSKNKPIYLDYSASTPIDKTVAGVVDRSMRLSVGNPSSVHGAGREAKTILNEARAESALVFGCKPDDCVFTSSGTEANNLAIIGVARAYKAFGKHIIISAIEHASVMKTCEHLEREEGFELTSIPVDRSGIVSPADIAKALRPDTILVSIMCANNEIGTIQPIREIAKVIQNYRVSKKDQSHQALPIFHTDACQAVGALSVQIKTLGVDCMTINSAKAYGPKGVGCLVKSPSIKLEPIIFGGGQERGLRSGTENVAGIAGFARALTIAERTRKVESKRLLDLRNFCIKTIQSKIPDVVVNGDLKQRLPNNINLSFRGVDGEALLAMLNNEGIYVSSGSACTAFSTEHSYVLKAIGVPAEYIGGSIRISLGRQTTKKDIDRLIKNLVLCVARLRNSRL